MLQKGSVADLPGDQGQHLVDGGSDPSADLDALGQAQIRVGVDQFLEAEHARFGLFFPHQVGRLIAGGAALGQDEELFAVALAYGAAGFVPEVGGHEAVPFGNLGRAGQVDDHAGQLAGGVVGEQQVHAVILVPLDVREVVGAGVAVHLRRAVALDLAPVETDDRLAAPPGHGAGLALLPGGGHALGGALDEEGGVLAGFHHFGAHVLPFVIRGGRGGVGVRGADEHVLRHQVRRRFGELLAHAE